MVEKLAPLRVVRVELPADSLQTHRELHGLHPRHYRVMVGLSRAATSFEDLALRRMKGRVRIDTTDRRWGEVADTTLEGIEAQLQKINAELGDAERLGRQMQLQALEEDDRLMVLVARINVSLNLAVGDALTTDEIAELTGDVTWSSPTETCSKSPLAVGTTISQTDLEFGSVVDRSPRHGQAHYRSVPSSVLRSAMPVGHQHD